MKRVYERYSAERELRYQQLTPSLQLFVSRPLSSSCPASLLSLLHPSIACVKVLAAREVV